MNPIIGQLIAWAGVLIILFFAGRSVFRGILSELRGEKSCALCGCGKTAGCGGASCQACMLQIEKLKQLEKKKGCPHCETE